MHEIYKFLLDIYISFRIYVHKIYRFLLNIYIFFGIICIKSKNSYFAFNWGVDGL